MKTPQEVYEIMRQFPDVWETGWDAGETALVIRLEFGNLWGYFWGVGRLEGPSREVVVVETRFFDGEYSGHGIASWQGEDEKYPLHVYNLTLLGRQKLIPPEILADICTFKD